MSESGRADFERALRDLLVRFGAAPSPDLDVAVAGAVAQMREALALGAAEPAGSHGESLSARDVVRVRANKFAAARLPPAVFRDRAQLALLRREIKVISEAWLPDGDASFFG